MKMNTIFASIIFLLALWLTLGLGLAMAGIHEPQFLLQLFYPALVLWGSFHLSSWYLVLMSLVVAWKLNKASLRQRHFVQLCLGIFPMVAFGLFLRISLTDTSLSPLPNALVNNFGQTGAGVLSALVGLFSSASILLIPLLGFTPEQGTKSKTQDTKQKTSDKQDDQYPEDKAVRDFKTGLSGLLETRTRAVPVYTDLGSQEDIVQNEVQENVAPPVLQTKKIKIPEHKPDLEVFFSKEGNISDYPPNLRRSWVEAEDDEGQDQITNSAPVLDTQKSESIEAMPKQMNQTLEVPDDFRIGHQRVADLLKNTDAPVHKTIKSLPDHLNVPVEILEDEIEEDNEDDVEDDLDDDFNEVVAEVRVNEMEAFDDGARVVVNHSTNIVSESPISPLEVEATESVQVADEAVKIQEPDVRLLPPLPEKMRSSTRAYSVPVAGLLDEPEGKEYWLIDEATTRSAYVLKQTLEEFGIQAEVTGIRKGPVITMFEILPAPGVKLNRITNLSDNIALRLAAQSVRIVAPIPGKHAVGIEIPNRDRAKVSFSELLVADAFSSPKLEIPVALGKDITGDAQIIDLARTPHLLIAGSTGSGKSVCVNALICSIMYRLSPAEVNMILIDPKIVELKFYNDIPHLLTPVITDPKRAFQALQWCLFEMERRYSLLDAMQVRDIKSYNRKIKAKNIATPHMPYLVIVIDEFADLMATSGKELEGTLARLAAMSRAVGIHLVLATQRPSTDVITGLIKANIPSRIAFMVASKIDSRIILDTMGAEKLLGKGDMLFTSAWDPFPLRLQGAFLSEDEVERIVSHVKTLGKPDYIDDEIFFDAEEEEAAEGDDDFEGGDDPLMKSAIDIVVTAKKASASYLQRRLKIGYNRAARLIEQMESMGIVGPPNGSKPRDILRMFQN